MTAVRILHVNKFLYRRGGAEAYMLDTAERQQAGGHDVEFFGMQHPQNLPMRYARSFPTEVQFDPAPAGVPGKVRSFGRMMWSESARRGIATVVEDFRPDVVHLHNIYHQLSPSVLRPLAARGIPAVMTLHDYKLACPTYQMLDKGQLCDACLDGGPVQAVRRRCKDGSLLASGAAAVEVGLHRGLGAYRHVGRFLCPSRFLADAMGRAGLPAERLHVLNNPVDVSAVRPAAEPGAGLVVAARLSVEKGVDTLLDAVDLLHRGGTPVTLEVLGDGPARAALEERARPLGAAVTFHGHQPKERVLDLVRAAAVAVVPSRWNENQPLSVLEAFGCGVPVVATRLGGLPELVEPGVDGDLVPHDDPAALAAALRPLVVEPSRAHAMGRSARRKVENGFAVDRHLQDLQHHYDAVAGRSLAQQGAPR